MAAASHTPGFFLSTVISEAWRIFGKSWTTLLGYFVLMIVLMVIPMMVVSSVFGDTDLGGLIRFLLIFWNMILSMGWTKVLIKISREESVSMNDLWNLAPRLPKYILGSILYALIVIIGFILLIIPGIIWSIKYMFIPYLIIDKGLGPMEAMNKSAKMTDGIKWDLLGANIVLGYVALMGLLALGFGILVTAPVAMVAGFLIYNLALKRAGE